MGEVLATPLKACPAARLVPVLAAGPGSTLKVLQVTCITPSFLLRALFVQPSSEATCTAAGR